MNKPRTCDIHLSGNNENLDFEVINGNNNIGLYIQQVVANSTASHAGLRDGDRIIEINGVYVDDDSSQSIQKKLNRAISTNILRLHVADTNTYEYYKRNNMDLSSINAKRIQYLDGLRVMTAANNHYSKTNEQTHQNYDNRNRNNQFITDKKFDGSKNQQNINIQNRNHDRDAYQKNKPKYTNPNTSQFNPRPRAKSCFRQRNIYHIHKSEEILERPYPAHVQRVQGHTNLNNTVMAQTDLFVTEDSIQVHNGRIHVCFGDLTTQKVDAIVVPTASEELTEDILKNAGKSISEEYYERREQGFNRSICTNGGQLQCERIYFIPCTQLSRNANKWIFRSFVHDAIELASMDTTMTIYSLAFPAIGCGQFHDNAGFIAKTLIMAVEHELKNLLLNLTVYFIIRNTELDIFKQFMRELKTLGTIQSSHTIDETSTTLTHLHRKPQRNDSDENTFIVQKRILDDSSDEYHTVIEMFWDTMTSERCNGILRIEKILNKCCFEQYKTHRKAFYERLKRNTEKLLFHGCSEDAAKSIINGNFDRSYAGQHGMSYGHGVYFSSKASYSHGYTIPNSRGERCMFLAKVLIGNTTQGHSSMRVRPSGYDSTTDGSHIYVTYHDAQAYAQYLITYK